MLIQTRITVILAVFLIVLSGLVPLTSATDFRDTWEETPNRTWIGPDFWANRLQDWRIQDGRLECVTPQRNVPLRTLYLLTRQLSDEQGEFRMSVNCGLTHGKGDDVNSDAMAGFLIGVGNGKVDYRSSALISGRPGTGAGWLCGIDSTGQPRIIDLELPLPPGSQEGPNERQLEQYRLELSGQPADRDSYRLTLRVLDSKNQIYGVTEKVVPAERVIGTIGLVSHPGTKLNRDTAGLFWFHNLHVEGSKLKASENQKFGPIACTQYTLSRDVLKLTAQLMPLGAGQPHDLALQTHDGIGWIDVATSKVVVPGWTSTFRIPNWDAKREVRYRVLYRNEIGREHEWPGVVRRDPVDKPVITVAGFTGNHNNARNVGVRWPHGKQLKPCDWLSGIYFPHADLTSRVEKHKPDVLFFSGDQVYEGDSPSFADSKNLTLDYMYKWYLWCWAYRDLAREIPCVCIPDDHDVYQGNLWGQGGRKSPGKDYDGGYVHPASWVNLVHRTQTTHLPDPFDPTPIEQDISVYYTNMTYGRISFAVIADRMFKNGCNGQGLPSTGTHRPDHFNDPNLDTRTLDIPGMKLLGDRQLNFLSHWVDDWEGVDMKVLLSQTIFANAATHHGPGLFRSLTDLDSNGWPQSGRNRALSILRKGFVFHIGGDQHLATLIHHGVESHGDSIWSFAVPSIANFYPRAWAPKHLGKYQPPDVEDYTGEFLDGFQNKITMVAATNPGRPSGHEPVHLHDRMPGYGIVKLDKSQRTITVECWPRYADPSAPSTGEQYLGWPQTIQQTDNYDRKPTGWLPKLQFEDRTNPVVRVFEEASDELVYALRVRGGSFQPPVYSDRAHTVELEISGTDKHQKLTGLIPREDQISAGAIDIRATSQSQ